MLEFKEDLSVLEDAGEALDLAMLELYREEQSPLTIEGLELKTKLPKQLLRKAELLKIWFELGKTCDHTKALGNGFFNNVVNQLVNFLIDPAQGVSLNPLIARNRFVMPMLAGMRELWDDSEFTDLEKEKYRVECERQNMELAKKLEIHSNVQDVNHLLIKGLKTKWSDIEDRLRKEKISLKKLPQEKSLAKKIRALKVLRKIREEEIQAEIDEREKRDMSKNQLVKVDKKWKTPRKSVVVGSATFEHRQIVVQAGNLSEVILSRAMREAWEASWLGLVQHSPEKISEKIQLLATRRRKFNVALAATIDGGRVSSHPQMCQFQRMTTNGFTIPCFNGAIEHEKFCKSHKDYKGTRLKCNKSNYLTAVSKLLLLL